MPRELYGIAEIADALGLTRQAVTVWRKRRSWGMPEADVELASGPVWQAHTIEPWLRTQRSRLSQETGGERVTTGDVRRAARRLLRLLALLLEEPHRPNLVQQALREVEQFTGELARATDDEERARLLRLLVPLAGPGCADPRARAELTRLAVSALPELHEILLERGIEEPVPDSR
ncbi:hypothetical protein [Actinomadura roseirufa]|uniref:hypothetical protein n=1 Tax=Actinomadura roseirufa TaxID=2094049 RepID=UPI001041A098|nr:hypothetical protein [Actinomadura roseirufa]